MNDVNDTNWRYTFVKDYLKSKNINHIDMTNVIKFKYLEYLTNLHLNRYEIAEQNYEESKVLFDFFNVLFFNLIISDFSLNIFINGFDGDDNGIDIDKFKKYLDLEAINV